MYYMITCNAAIDGNYKVRKETTQYVRYYTIK